MSYISERKEARFKITEGNILNARTYNLAFGGMVLYGLAANILMYHFFGDIASTINPFIFYIGYFVCTILGIVLSSQSTNPIISFIGYNLVVVPIGLAVGITVESYVKNGDAELVFQAISLTSVITAIMIILSIIFPRFFSKIGGLLFGALIGLIIAEILSIFFFPWAQTAISWIGAGIFTLYIGFDYWKAQQYPKTLDNAIDSAVDIYLDIINLFLQILEILGSDSRD